MVFPLGYEPNDSGGDVFQLQKILYGLKQLFRSWFRRFIIIMKRFRYNQSNSDHTLFIKWQGDHVIIYVNDMIFTRNDPEKTKKKKSNIQIWDEGVGKSQVFSGN
jgi:hypothetical protein